MAKAASATNKIPGIEIYLENVRASYLHVFKAFAPPAKPGEEKQKPKFNGKFVLNKKKHKKLIAEVEDAIESLCEQAWGGRPKKMGDDKVCLRDGDDEDGEEFHGAMILSASNAKRPEIRDRDKTPLVEEDGRPYSGCFVNVVVRLWVQDNDWGKRINASLEIIQYFGKGEAFGPAKPDADKYLKDYSDEDEDEDDDDRPAKKKPSAKRSRDEDDDEDERPAKRKPTKRSREEDDDDMDEAPPKKKRVRDFDDEEDEPKPKKKKVVVEDDDDDEDEDDRPARRRR